MLRNKVVNHQVTEASVVGYSKDKFSLVRKVFALCSPVYNFWYVSGRSFLTRQKAYIKMYREKIVS
jgi:hypothetical protein